MRIEQLVLLSKLDLEEFVGGKRIRFESPGKVTMAFDPDDLPNLLPITEEPRIINGTGTVIKRRKLAALPAPSHIDMTTIKHVGETTLAGTPRLRSTPRCSTGFKCPKCKVSFSGRPTAFYASHVRYTHPKRSR